MNMSDVTRYQPDECGWMAPANDGNYVLFDEHEAALATLRTQLAEVTEQAETAGRFELQWVNERDAIKKLVGHDESGPTLIEHISAMCNELASLKAGNHGLKFDAEYQRGRANTLEKQLAEAKVVIEKLPKTADGVPITQGMQLFLPPDLGGGEVCPILQCYRMMLDDAETNSWQPDWSSAFGPNVVFSSRAAALAAQKGGGE